MTNWPTMLALWVHPLMLGWLGAAAIPLVIHLLNRRKYRVVPWAAMQYLMAAMRKNARRIRIEQWLLLAVRTLLIVCVVLAVAEPLLKRTGVLARSGHPTHKLLVVDASYSMAFKQSERSRFDLAKQLAEQIVEESSQGDGFTLVLLADPPQVVVGTPSFAHAEFLGEIANLRITHGGGDLAATLARVDEVLETAAREYPRLEQKQVFFLTDLGRTTWAPDLNASAMNDFRERSRRLGEKASLTMIDLGQPSAENVAVEQLRVLEPVATVAQEATFVGEVRNFGRQERNALPIELYVDGRRAGEQTIDLPAGGRATVSFPARFDTAGDHVVELRAATDALAVDDRRYFVAPVKDQIRVLCVDGRPSGGNFQSATDYLMQALAPSTSSRQRAAVRPQAVPERALLDSDLAQYDCIFLCDVAQFTAREASLLRAYLNRGGGLVFFLGAQVRADSYNRQLADVGDDDRRVLPARLGKVVSEPRYGLDPVGYKHPLIAVFRDQEQAGLLTTPVQKYFQLEMPENSRAKVALALENGDPLIVEESIARGRSILVATSADTSWTAWPVWPSYVPIVQELLMWASRGLLQDRNVQVAQPIGGALPSAAAREIEVRTPSGDTKRATISDTAGQRQWTYADTSTSGIFRAQLAGKDASAETFAVNVDTRESNLDQIDPSELANDVWRDVHFAHRTNWRGEEVDDVRSEIVLRSRLHVWLLCAALALVMTESFLNWFTSRNAR